MFAANTAQPEILTGLYTALRHANAAGARRYANGGRMPPPQPARLARL